MDMHVTQQTIEHVKTAGDATSIGVLLTTLFGFLPHIASLLTVVWMAIRIWETKTVQCWREKIARRKRAKNRT